jgi:hypothetical protein
MFDSKTTYTKSDLEKMFFALKDELLEEIQNLQIYDMATNKKVVHLFETEKTIATKIHFGLYKPE